MSDNQKLNSILAKRQAKYGEKTSTYTSIFMISIFIIGIILTVVGWDIDKKIEDKKCTSTALKTANKLIYTIGIVFIVSSLSFYACTFKCGDNIQGVHHMVYLVMLFLLGILLIVLGSVVQANSKDECANSGNPTIIWTLGVIIVLGCGLYFYSEFKKNKY